MRRRFKALRARLRGRGGMSLAEVMIAVLIMSMVMAVLAVGVPAAVRSYRAAVDNANAQVYLSTVMTELRDELGLASDVSADGGMIRYRSAEGLSAVLSSESDGIYRQYTDDSIPAGLSGRQQLVDQSASGSTDMFAQFELDACAGGVVTFRTVSVKRGSDTLASMGPYQIRVLAAPTS